MPAAQKANADGNISNLNIFFITKEMNSVYEIKSFVKYASKRLYGDFLEKQSAPMWPTNDKIYSFFIQVTTRSCIKIEKK